MMHKVFALANIHRHSLRSHARIEVLRRVVGAICVDDSGLSRLAETGGLNLANDRGRLIGVRLGN